MDDSSAATPDAARLARFVLTKNLKVRPGERVTIEAWPHTLPWAVALARECRRLRAIPLIHYEDEESFWDSIASGEAKVLGATPAHEWAALAKTDVYLHMWGPGDRVRLSGLPPKRAAEIFAWNAKWYAAAHKAGLRGARLEVGRPYPSLAKLYGVDEAEWRDRIVAATMQDPDRMARAAQPVARAFERGRRIRITHPNGTDLTLGLAGRATRLAAGRFEKGDLRRPFGSLINLPGGSIRVALDERVADGTFLANRTNYFDDGTATGGRFEFAGGRLTSARFETGQEQFDKPYKSGGPGRDRPGLLGIGLNPSLHDTPQVEDLEAGVILLSVGTNSFFGGRNKSPLFGYSVLAGATLEVDGQPIGLPGPTGP